jgi:serine/threonine protein kinase
MNESNEREEHIFAEALAIPEGEWPRFFEEACKGDADLRRRIELLLKAHRSAGKFMESPAGPGPPGDSPAPAAPPAPSEVSGTRIGRYKLLQKIGEGGCGVVWMAEQQEPVRRQVALKIVKLGMDTREVIARFDSERQALAMLDHPNIAKILDAGATETGRPFFVMELVRGTKITEFCDRNNLSMAQRLQLFSEVCHAVQHAHQKGIIHRDIKPSNILVTLIDGVPVPKVIDFGIAKATAGRLTDHTLFTAFEQFIGTPAYMSPEQAELSGIDVDTRSDIYSLGVLLYELLSGRLPFDPKSLLRAGLDEIRRIIREVEPPRPSTNLSTLADADRAQVARMRSTDSERLSLLLRGDLDWIVMRCLEKNRARRYDTPNALAEDIARHLRHEPVIARPPSRVYRFNRLVRRNRFAFAAAASIALALTTGLVLSSWQAVRATRAQRLADRERAQAVAERIRAEDLLKFMLGDLYTQLGRVGRLDVLESVADKATAYFASLDPGDLNDTTQLSRARALRLLSGVRISQARYTDAENALSEAYSRSSDLAARHPRDGEALYERAQAEFGIGIVHWKRAEYPAASDWLTRYHDTAAALVALDPARADWQLELADGQFNLAVLKDERGDLAEARSAFVEELAVLARMIAADPGNLELRGREADAHSWLGGIEEEQGDMAGATKEYATQATELENLVQADPMTVNRRQYQAIALLFLVSTETVTGRYAEASESLGKAQNLLEGLVALDSNNVDWRGIYENGRIAEALLARARGDIAGALHIVEEALPQIQDVSTKEPTEHVYATLLVRAWRMKAHFQSLSDEAGASDSARHAVELGEKLARREGAADSDFSECARSLIVAGEIAAKSGDGDAARRDWLRAAEVLGPRQHGSHHWTILDPAARAEALLGRLGEARTTIGQLNLLGYVPIEPWPDMDQLATTKTSDPQQK